MIVKNKKGISTFIATLLLMVLAVAAGVVIYAYTMGYLGGFGGPQTMGAIAIDTWSLDVTTPDPLDVEDIPVGLTVYIRNIGKTSFNASTVYINGIRIAESAPYVEDRHNALSGWAFNRNTDGDQIPIKEGEIGILTIQKYPESYASPEDYPPVMDRQALGTTGAYGFQPGTTYDIKIIGEDNTQTSFQVKK
jgi:hypothetical protein